MRKIAFVLTLILLIGLSGFVYADLGSKPKPTSTGPGTPGQPSTPTGGIPIPPTTGGGGGGEVDDIDLEEIFKDPIGINTGTNEGTVDVLVGVDPTCPFCGRVH